MRVLWFTGSPLPAYYRHVGIPLRGSGHWHWTLLDSLKKATDWEIAVVSAVPGATDCHIQEDRVDHFVLHQKKRRFSLDNYDANDIRRCVEIVSAWDPDLIHVHGTERFYGLLSAEEHTAVPTLVSIQGMVNPYLRVFWGGLKLRDIIAMHSPLQLALLRGWWGLYLRWLRHAAVERRIITGNRFFAGRTEWDRAQVRALNPAATYLTVGEVLRQEFFDSVWSVDACEKHTLFFSNANEPRRGTGCLLQAAAILKQEFPSLRVRLGRVAGTGRFARLVRGWIQEQGLSDCVDVMPYLGVGEMIRQMKSAHVFVMPSYAENSPNSLCEAQLVGMPCVASCVGGIPSLVRHGKTGLLFPPGDAPMLAERIREVFRSHSLAERLGQNARTEAIGRHASTTVVKQMLEAYATVVNSNPLRNGNPGLVTTPEQPPVRKAR